VGGVVSDVINYEQVGLTLKFTPTVFPNQDVQVKMSIESKDVSGASTLTPIFTERSINGTARIQNNKTLLLASVAQDVESRGRTGLPLLGLIPVLGRLFTAPTRDNRQVDIVIAITPRVIRAPAILPEDEVEMPTGSVATPTSGSLEAMIIQEERNEFLASLERNRGTAQAQHREQTSSVPEFVRTGTPGQTSSDQVQVMPRAAEPSLRPIDTGVRTLQLTQTADQSMTQQTHAANAVETEVATMRNDNPAEASPVESTRARLAIPGELPRIKTGERVLIPVSIESAEAFRSAVLGLKFDQSKVTVRTVAFGDVFGPALSGSAVQPFLNQNGKLFLSLAMPFGADEGRSGVLAMIEIEALEDGVPSIEFEKDVLNVMGIGGKTIAVRF
jgi:Flp pilus assembly secretin CpaC